VVEDERCMSVCELDRADMILVQTGLHQVHSKERFGLWALFPFPFLVSCALASHWETRA
jgi:hypothetical protein